MKYINSRSLISNFAEPNTKILGNKELFIETGSTINLNCIIQPRLMVLPASMNSSLLPKIVVLGSARLERWGVIHKFKVIKVKVVNVKSKWDIVFSNFVALFWRTELLTILICLLFGRFYNLKLRNRQILEYLLYKKGYPINLGWHIEKAFTFVLQQMQPINGLSYRPLVYLNLIFEILQFEILSLMNLSFTGCLRQKNLVQTGKKSSLWNSMFQLENCKNQVQIDRGESLTLYVSMYSSSPNLIKTFFSQQFLIEDHT